MTRSTYTVSSGTGAFALTLYGVPLAAGFPASRILDGGSDPLQNVRPCAIAGLPEQPRGRIPWTVHPVAQPSKVGMERQQQPGRFAERAGQMCNRGIDGNHDIHVRDQRGGLAEIV